MFFILFLLNNILLVNSVYYISEINFENDEYLEIYSDKILNLSNSTFHDENLFIKNNSLELIRYTKSNFTLIVGESFLENKDISNLNCSIYKTDKSQISNGGLRSGGEDFYIYKNNLTILNYSNIGNYDFAESESLNFNLENNSYYVSNQSICKENIVFKTNFTMLNSLSNTTLIDNFDCNSYFFEINPLQEIFEDKIQFNFLTNASNFVISYWVEEYGGDIVKSKIDTTNKNIKSYTPKDKSEMYSINANINFNNCLLSDSREVFYFSDNSKISIKEDETNLEKDSYIKILNYDDLKNKATNEILYEIYRGDTSKRTVYFYLDKNKVAQFEIEKYSKIKGKLDIYSLEKVKNIQISGLGELFSINTISKGNNSFFEIKENKKVKQYFEVKNFSLNLNKINFIINSNLENLTYICYINNKKSLVSKKIGINDPLFLIINESLLDENNVALKLICKYKKSFLKTEKYFSFLFNYTKTSDKLRSYSDLTNKSLNSLGSQNFFEESDHKSSQLLSNIISGKHLENNLVQDKLEEKIVYESRNIKFKNNSIYIIYFTMLSIIIYLIYN